MPTDQVLWIAQFKTNRWLSFLRFTLITSQVISHCLLSSWSSAFFLWHNNIIALELIDSWFFWLSDHFRSLFRNLRDVSLLVTLGHSVSSAERLLGNDWLYRLPLWSFGLFNPIHGYLCFTLTPFLSWSLNTQMLSDVLVMRSVSFLLNNWHTLSCKEIGCLIRPDVLSTKILRSLSLKLAFNMTLWIFLRPWFFLSLFLCFRWLDPLIIGLWSGSSLFSRSSIWPCWNLLVSSESFTSRCRSLRSRWLLFGLWFLIFLTWRLLDAVTSWSSKSLLWIIWLVSRSKTIFLFLFIIHWFVILSRTFNYFGLGLGVTGW